MRRTLIVLGIALLAAVPWARAAEETVESLGFEEEPVKESMFAALRGWYQAPPIPAPVRSMPAEQKVAAVQVLGTFAKSYFGSSEFKKDYGQAFKASRPHTGFAMPSFDALKKSATDKAAEQVTGPKAEAGVLEKDPKVQLRKRLESFLAATKDVGLRGHDPHAERLAGLREGRIREEAQRVEDVLPGGPGDGRGPARIRDRLGRGAQVRSVR